MPETAYKNAVIAARISVSTYNLLRHISEATHIRKSSLLRAAVTQWLQNAPSDTLPVDLRIEITRANMQHQVETAKNLWWCFHQARQAHAYLKEIDRQTYLPPHATAVIQQVELKIITLPNELDTWLREQHSKGETP